MTSRCRKEAKWLVGFWLNRGAASPRKTPSKWMREGIRPGSFWGRGYARRSLLQVDSIRHWQLFNCSYADAPTPRTATWFVDPRMKPREGTIASAPSSWTTRPSAPGAAPALGQVIVCENEGATCGLPFRELADEDHPR